MKKKRTPSSSAKAKPKGRVFSNPFEACRLNQLQDTFPKISTDEYYSESTEQYLLTFLDLDDSQALPVIELGFSFVNTFNEVKLPLSQKVLNRMFEVCFTYPTLTAKLEYVMRNCDSLAWIHWGLHEMMTNATKMSVFKQSIKDDNPIWSMILEKMEIDLMNGEKERFDDHSKNKRGFLIEALPFYWDIDPNEKSSISVMVRTVTKFLVETNSKTSQALMDLLYSVFPREVVLEVKDKAWTLKSDHFMDVDDSHWEFLPHGDIDAAVKIALANPIKAKNLMTGDAVGERIIDEMLAHFDDRTGKFKVYEEMYL